jgi:hypothetical protein
MPAVYIKGALASIWFNLPKATSISDVLSYLQTHLTKDNFPQSPNPYLPDPEITFQNGSYEVTYSVLSLPVYLVKDDINYLLGFAHSFESALPLYAKKFPSLNITPSKIQLVTTVQAVSFNNYFTWPHFQCIVQN